MFCMIISWFCVSLMFTVTFFSLFFVGMNFERMIWQYSSHHAHTHTHTHTQMDFTEESLYKCSISIPVTVVKEGCIDQILLFEKSGIGLCAEIFMPAV